MAKIWLLKIKLDHWTGEVARLKLPLLLHKEIKMTIQIQIQVDQNWKYFLVVMSVLDNLR